LTEDTMSIITHPEIWLSAAFLESENLTDSFANYSLISTNSPEWAPFSDGDTVQVAGS